MKTGGPIGQVGNWAFIDFFIVQEMSLRCRQKFPGKEKCLLGQLSHFGSSCSPPFKSSLSKIALIAVRDKDKKSMQCLLPADRGR
jgi:hypothetical protein